MNSPRSISLRIISLFIIAGTCTSSYADVADWFTSKRMASLAVIAVVGRLVTKDANEMDITLSQEVRKLRTTKPLTQAWFQQLWSVFDDFVIGHPGKGRGLKVAGSSVAIEGKEVALGSYLNENDLAISLYGYKRVPASGVLGITWSHMKDIVSGLRFVKEVDDIGIDFGLMDEPVFTVKRSR
jgi:hypothetical protein